MLNILFVNLNVGSAIEQSGQCLIEKLNKEISDIEVFTYQTCESYFYSYLLEKKPTNIIVNGFYPRILTPLYYYLLEYSDTNLILISRVFSDFYLSNNINNFHNFYYEQRLKYLFDKSSKIIIVNSCGYSDRILSSYSNKVIDCCGLNNSDFFKIKRPWGERKNKFLIFCSLDDRKLSKEFISELNNLDISIDTYGSIQNQSTKLSQLFNNSKNINYHGHINFKDVPDLFNQYKYYLLPHNGTEPLCNTIIQSILCGTIPIVLDDNCIGIDNRYWLKYAQGLYFGCDNITDYINCINDLTYNDISNGNSKSYYIRNTFLNTYDDIFKRRKLCRFLGFQ